MSGAVRKRGREDSSLQVCKPTATSVPTLVPWVTRGNTFGVQRLADGGKFFLIMQDDGNLCVYKGTGPQDQGAFVWGSKN
jgi:hypothetical protein